MGKGVESAKKNLTKVPVLKGTVPHEQSAKFGGAEVFIKPASHGTGVVAGGIGQGYLIQVVSLHEFIEHIRTQYYRCLLYTSRCV